MKYILIFTLIAFTTALYISGAVLNVYTITNSNIKREAALWEYCTEDTSTAVRSCQSIESLSSYNTCTELGDRFRVARAFTMITSILAFFTLVLSIIRVAADWARRGGPRYVLVFLEIATPLFGLIGFAATGSLYTISFCDGATVESLSGSELGPSLPLYVVGVAFSFITVVFECCLRGRNERKKGEDDENNNKNDNEQEMTEKKKEEKSNEPVQQ